MPTSPRARTRAHVEVAVLARQDNRTKYVVYAHEHTAGHDRFLNALWRRLPRAATRAQIRAAVEDAGGGAYRLRYNSILAARPASAARKLF